MSAGVNTAEVIQRRAGPQLMSMLTWAEMRVMTTPFLTLPDGQKLARVE